MGCKPLHCLLVNSPQLLLVFMVLLLLVSIPLLFVLLERIDLRVQRSHSPLLSSFGSSHHLVVQLSIHLIRLFSFLASATSFGEQGGDVGTCDV